MSKPRDLPPLYPGPPTWLDDPAAALRQYMPEVPAALAMMSLDLYLFQRRSDARYAHLAHVYEVDCDALGARCWCKFQISSRYFVATLQHCNSSIVQPHPCRGASSNLSLDGPAHRTAHRLGSASHQAGAHRHDSHRRTVAGQPLSDYD